MSAGQGKPGAAPRRTPTGAFRTVADEGGLVVLPDRSVVNVLNPVGSKIYSMLDGQHTEAEIVRAIVEEFEVTEEQATQDLRSFLAELDAAGMLARDKPDHHAEGDRP